MRGKGTEAAAAAAAAVSTAQLGIVFPRSSTAVDQFARAQNSSQLAVGSSPRRQRRSAADFRGRGVRDRAKFGRSSLEQLRSDPGTARSSATSYRRQ